MHDQPNVKLCECGCGQPAPIAKRTRAALGHVKGQPQRFIQTHSASRTHREPPSPPNPSGFCQCGCGERTPIATKTQARRGIVKGEPTRFIAGHIGRALTPESRQKMSDAHKRVPLEPGHRRSISLAAGGTGEPRYGPIHGRLARRYPKTGACEECGKQGRTHYAFLRHPEPHTEKREDYRELCPTCHRRFDAWLRS